MVDIIPAETITSRIILLREQKVILDRDLADLYEVTTKSLNQAVKRNLERFPKDFVFTLTEKEKTELVTNCDRFKNLKHSTSLPYAFTEQGVAMLSSVLKSPRAIKVNIQIMRIFTRLRRMLTSHEDLERKIEEMEARYDEQFQAVFEVFKRLIDEDEQPHEGIGFVKEEQADFTARR